MELYVLPSRLETELAFQIITDETPGFDNIPVELLQRWEERGKSIVFSQIRNCFEGRPIPLDWIGNTLVSLFKGKGKGSKSVCDNHDCIILIETFGKLFVRLLLNRPMLLVRPLLIPETHCFFSLSGGEQ